MHQALVNTEGAKRHKAQPHSRIVLTLILVFCVVNTHAIMAHFLFALITVYLWKQSDLSLRQGVKRLLLVDSLILFTVLPLPFSFVDENVIHIGSITLSETGLTKAVEVMVKSTLSMGIVITQLSSLSESQLSLALHRLKLPSRFVVLLQLTVRYISVMDLELQKLKLTTRARGLGSGSVIHNLRSYGFLFGMLFVKALVRAEQVWMAMKCRGYRGHFLSPNQELAPLISKKEACIIALSLSILTADMVLMFHEFTHCLGGRFERAY